MRIQPTREKRRQMDVEEKAIKRIKRKKYSLPKFKDNER